MVTSCLVGVVHFYFHDLLAHMVVDAQNLFLHLMHVLDDILLEVRVYFIHKDIFDVLSHSI